MKEAGCEHAWTIVPAPTGYVSSYFRIECCDCPGQIRDPAAIDEEPEDVIAYRYCPQCDANDALGIGGEGDIHRVGYLDEVGAYEGVWSREKGPRFLQNLVRQLFARQAAEEEIAEGSLQDDPDTVDAWVEQKIRTWENRSSTPIAKKETEA